MHRTHALAPIASGIAWEFFFAGTTLSFHPAKAMQTKHKHTHTHIHTIYSYMPHVLYCMYKYCMLPNNSRCSVILTSTYTAFGGILLPIRRCCVLCKCAYRNFDAVILRMENDFYGTKETRSLHWKCLLICVKRIALRYLQIRNRFYGSIMAK